MLHKQFKRARREWNEVEDDASDTYIAVWARTHARELIKEVERLRSELKLRNKKRRHVYAKLAGERDDLDDVLDKVEDLRDRLPADPMESVQSGLMTDLLDSILNEFQEEDHDD